MERVNQWMLDTAFAKVPFYFYFHVIADHFFQIGLARCDHTSFSGYNRSFGVNSSGCQLPSKGPTPSMCLSMIFRTPFWRGVSVKTSLKVRLITLPSKRQMNLSSSNHALFYPLSCSLTRWKKWHNHLEHLKSNLPGVFFLNGTWSWPRCWRSDILSCPEVIGRRTRGVDIWLSLGNVTRCLNRNKQNSL